MGRLKTRIRIALTFLLSRPFTHITDSIVRDCEIVSFDVFDTLILRPGIAVPSDIFNLLHPEDSSFKAKRIQAEREARSSSPLEDVKLFDIYKILYPYDKDENTPEKQHEEMSLEISTELKLCKANSEALKFFNTVREAGKRVIITSDMYLSAATIKTILTENGFDLKGIPVYVSSEYGKTKRSGSLFKEVLKREQVKNGEEGHVLHIGDNLISDYLMPKRAGMKSFLYSHHP